MKIKKTAALVLAMLMTTAALAGCGGGGTENSENKDTTDVTKADGILLNSDTAAEETQMEIGDVEVSIGDAKLINYEGEDVVVVEYTLKNNGDAEQNFTGVVHADGYQDDERLTPTVVTGVDGVDMMTLSQNIGKGHRISVQKAFRLKSKDEIVEIDVTEITSGKDAPQSITKYYSISE